MYVYCVRNVVAHGDAREGKWRGNWRLEWVASTLMRPRNVVYPELLTLMRTPRLPAVDWTDSPTDLNGLVCLGERRYIVSAHVPSGSARALQPNIHARSHNQFFRGKAINIIFSNCTSVAFVIQNAKRMRRIVICSLSGCNIFSTLSHKRHDFRKNKLLNFYCCTVHFDNIKIPFTNKRTLY